MPNEKTEKAIRTIDEGWRIYTERYVHKDASDLQRMESRRAYYAGATAVFALMINAAIADGELTDEKQQAIHTELSEFINQVNAGKA